ncbi:MAG: hypothetical protein ABW252_16075 [Polyangiales bacterium]
MIRTWPLSILALVACDREIPFGTLAAGTGGGPTNGTFSCAQRGPLHEVGDGSEAACGASSAGFHFAVCSCGNLTSERETLVDGFDSARAPYAPGEASGALGVNGGLYPHPLTLGGSLVIAGGAGAPLGGDVTVGGHLANAGQLQNPYVVRVAGNARIAGDVRPQRIEVGGTFTLAPTSAFEPREPASVPVRASVAIAPPCRCDGARSLDVVGIVRAAESDHDDDRIDLDPERGLRLDAGGTRSLPCGRYYVDDIFTAGRLTLRITGRVALYVGQRIVLDPSGQLDVELLDDAELDLYVAGGISASGSINLGSPRHPDRVRLYVGGNVAAGTAGTGDNIYFGAPSVIAAAVHAPHSELVAGASFELYGAALLASTVFSQPARLHFDRALVGDRCDAATCTRDADCAAPLRCDGTRCLP